MRWPYEPVARPPPDPIPWKRKIKPPPKLIVAPVQIPPPVAFKCTATTISFCWDEHPMRHEQDFCTVYEIEVIINFGLYTRFPLPI